MIMVNYGLRELNDRLHPKVYCQGRRLNEQLINLMLFKTELELSKKLLWMNLLILTSSLI